MCICFINDVFLEFSPAERHAGDAAYVLAVSRLCLPLIGSPIEVYDGPAVAGGALYCSQLQKNHKEPCGSR
jgi:hypothetical protein